MAQPSKEYMDWFASKVAKSIKKAVQKTWKPGEGDWLYCVDEEDGSVTVYCIGGDEPAAEVVSDWEGYGTVDWIPDLSQWLDMIEAKLDTEERFNFDGFAFRRRFLEDGQKRWSLSPKPPWMGMRGWGAAKEIAAAQLWGRLQGIWP